MPEQVIRQTIYHDRFNNITIIGEIDLDNQLPITILVKDERCDDDGDPVLSCSPFMAEKLAAFFDRAYELYRLKWPDKVRE